jgi:hypothetical protein
MIKAARKAARSSSDIVGFAARATMTLCALAIETSSGTASYQRIFATSERISSIERVDSIEDKSMPSERPNMERTCEIEKGRGPRGGY